MPKVGSTHYPYTKKGKRDAKLARERQASKFSGGGALRKKTKRKTK